MAYINLLPWREAQHQQQKKQYFILLAALFTGGVLIMWSGGFILEQILAKQYIRNAYLDAEIGILDTQIDHIKRLNTQRSALEQKIHLVEQLQISRHVIPKILDHLAQLLPVGLTFSSMHRTDNMIEIEGHSVSNNHLSIFMHNLNQSDIFLNEELISIKADMSSSHSHSKFHLSVRIAPVISPKAFDNHKASITGEQ